MAKKTEAVQVKVRMPKELQRKIQRDADRNGQTINAEILRRLVHSYQTDEALKGMEDRARAELLRVQEELTKLIIERTEKMHVVESAVAEGTGVQILGDQAKKHKAVDQTEDNSND